MASTSRCTVARRRQSAIDGGLADFRLSNYYLGHADSLLGVRHPALSAAPYQPNKNNAAEPKTPLVATPPSASLATTIAFGTPLLRETLHADITHAYLHLNEAASNYYAVLISRLRVDGAQRQAQKEWVDGVRVLQRGDELLARGILAKGSATGKREIESALSTLSRATLEISHADTLLGVHQSGPTVTLPTKIVYS
jgi:hypothetical protein